MLPRAVDATTVLPRVPAADRTAVLPKVPPADKPAAPEDRVPPGLWRDEKPPVEETREMPAVEPRPRPSWAEETPMDDLPSLTDTLLGSRDEWAQWQGGEPEDPRGGKGRKRK